MAEPAGPQDERRVQEILLGAPLRFTRAQVERRAGISADFGTRLWRALGFPQPADDEVAFTERDLDALLEIGALLRSELVDEELVLHLARAVGQTMGRLAGWLGGVMVARTAAAPAGDAVAPELATLDELDELRPAFERLLLHGWRRQLAAVGLRSLTATAERAGDPAAGIALQGVGFADVVSFTRLSRGMAGGELAAFVERFETATAEVIAELGGWLVKTLGDEVLFAAADARGTAEIGLRIAERCADDPGLTSVRVGLAYGEVILRFGDVFGTPVNLAARLTSVARPGAVVIDGELADALAKEPYQIVPLRTRPLQGLGRVRPYALRRD